MSWFGSTDAETAWSACIEEFDGDVDRAIDHIKDALRDLESLQSSVSRLHDIKRQYQGADNTVLLTLAHNFNNAVSSNLSHMLHSARSAADSAQIIDRIVAGFG